MTETNRIPPAVAEHALAECERLRARVEELEAALQEIHDGNTMRRRSIPWTHADVIQRHYAIARAALAKGGK